MSSFLNFTPSARSQARGDLPGSSALYAVVLLVSLVSASISAINVAPPDEMVEARHQPEAQRAAPSERPTPDDQGGPASAG